MVQIRESQDSDQLSYHPGADFALAHSKIYMSKLLEFMKRLVLLTQSFRIFMTQGNSRIARRCLSKDPTFM